MKRIKFLSLIGVCVISIGAYFSPPQWVPWDQPAYGILRNDQEIDYWQVVYHPNKDVVVDSRSQGTPFVPEIYLYDGDGTLIDSFIGHTGDYKGTVSMPPVVGATNILHIELSSKEGTFPGKYVITKK